MRGLIRWTVAIAVASLALPAFAIDYFVSSVSGNNGNDGLTPGTAFATIQRGIDAANFGGGDIVFVADGVYAGAINYSGKDVIVRSTSDNPAACIIDGGGTTIGVQFVSGEPMTATLEGFTIRNCRALAAFESNNSAQGGAIRIAGSIPTFFSQATIRNCIIRDNVAIGGGPGAAGRGAGAYAEFGGGIFEDCSFINNVATGFSDTSLANCGVGTGGAASAALNGGFVFNNCTFTNNLSQGGTDGVNRVGSAGGAIYMDAGLLDMTLTGFYGNKSNTGGAVYLTNSSFFEFRNLALVNNEATEGDGGGIVLVDSFGLSPISGSTFARNLATGEGGAIYSISGSDFSVVNSIFWLNGANLGSNQIHNTGSASASYTLIQGGVPGSVTDGGNNISADPQFKTNPGVGNNGNIRLKSSSPALDIGDNASVVTAVDLDGNARIFETIVDLGAYEFSPNPLEMTIELQADVQAMITGGDINPLLGTVLRIPLDLAVNNLQNGNTTRAIRNLRDFIILVNLYQFLGILTPAEAAAFRADALEIIDMLL